MWRKYEEVYKEGVQEVASLRKDHEMRVRESPDIASIVNSSYIGIIHIGIYIILTD
jgi:hypothetical protein